VRFGATIKPTPRSQPSSTNPPRVTG
jgi:hypothetical protein